MHDLCDHKGQDPYDQRVPHENPLYIWHKYISNHQVVFLFQAGERRDDVSPPPSNHRMWCFQDCEAHDGIFHTCFGSRPNGPD